MAAGKVFGGSAKNITRTVGNGNQAKTRFDAKTPRVRKARSMTPDPNELLKQLVESSIANLGPWLVWRVNVELKAGRISGESGVLIKLLLDVYQRGVNDACEQLHELFRHHGQ